MTFDDFKKHYFTVILPNKPPFIRDGQALFNYLSMKWPEESNRIVDGSNIDIDCFTVDSRIPNTLEHLRGVWHKYPD